MTKKIIEKENIKEITRTAENRSVSATLIIGTREEKGEILTRANSAANKIPMYGGETKVAQYVEGKARDCYLMVVEFSSDELKIAWELAV